MTKKNLFIVLVLFVIIAGAAVGAVFFLRSPAPDILPERSAVSGLCIMSSAAID